MLALQPDSSLWPTGSDGIDEKAVQTPFQDDTFVAIAFPEVSKDAWGMIFEWDGCGLDRDALV